MTKSWWGVLLQWILWAMIMTLVMGWLGRNRLKSNSKTDAKRLVHPFSTLVIGVICFTFFSAITILSNVYANKTTSWWTTAVFISFALLALLLIADYYFARHEISDTGISYGRNFRIRGFIRWSEIKSVQYSHSMKWFRIESHSGQVARISAMLAGLSNFAQLVLQYAPIGSIEPDTKRILEETEKGNPPQVW